MYTLTVEKKVYNMASVFSIFIFLIVGSVAAWNYSQTKAFKED
jgi:arabinogalactan oligomer/maltooligosaccharide transport system permease protein